MEKQEILEFYRQTSAYTDLGYYKEFAKKLTNDINELCILQRKQIIHPSIFNNEENRNKIDKVYGDLRKVPVTKLRFEDDIFPTAQSILAELLRKNPNYTKNREAQDKVHVTCRGQSILLASVLKAKGISARVRSGFAEYINCNEIYYDHWITEYYNEKEKRWQLTDADEHCFDEEHDFDINDIPYDKFLFGANAYLGLRENKYNENSILYASNPPTLGMKAALRGLFYDFHSLMNDEIIFLHLPKYIQQKNFELTENEYKELDELAKLMLNPNDNFYKLKEVWDNNTKFRIMSGALN